MHDYYDVIISSNHNISPSCCPEICEPSMASSLCSAAILLLMFLALTESFSLQRHTQKSTRMFSTPSNPGEYLMSVDELKSELEMRGVSYEDCISKNELLDRLIQSRADGKASPDILKQFNSLDENSIPPEAFDDEEIMSQAVAKDGSLPGGLSAEALKALSSDKEIMVMLKDPKMQDMMSAVMGGGPDMMKKYLSDPDAMLLLQKLSTALNRRK